jgi:hypothetical protein
MDTRFVVVVVAFATIALLMVLVLRVRLEPDASRGWKPDLPPPPPLPRIYFVLLAAGYVVLVTGVGLGIVIHQALPLVVGYLVYFATIAARFVIQYRRVKAARRGTAT